MLQHFLRKQYYVTGYNRKLSDRKVNFQVLTYDLKVKRADFILFKVNIHQNAYAPTLFGKDFGIN